LWRAFNDGQRESIGIGCLLLNNNGYSRSFHRLRLGELPVAVEKRLPRAIEAHGVQPGVIGSQLTASFSQPPNCTVYEPSPFDFAVRFFSEYAPSAFFSKKPFAL
jgi:hypothetical protein